MPEAAHGCSCRLRWCATDTCACVWVVAVWTSGWLCSATGRSWTWLWCPSSWRCRWSCAIGLWVAVLVTLQDEQADAGIHDDHRGVLDEADELADTATEPATPKGGAVAKYAASRAAPTRPARGVEHDPDPERGAAQHTGRRWLLTSAEGAPRGPDLARHLNGGNVVQVSGPCSVTLATIHYEVQNMSDVYTRLSFWRRDHDRV